MSRQPDKTCERNCFWLFSSFLRGAHEPLMSADIAEECKSPNPDLTMFLHAPRISSRQNNFSQENIAKLTLLYLSSSTIPKAHAHCRTLEFHHDDCDTQVAPHPYGERLESASPESDT